MGFPYLAWFAPFLPVVIVAIFAFPLAWVSLRVKSLFLLRARLWRWANRHDGGGQEWMGEPVAQRRELMKFRSLLAWADSYPQAQRITRWARDNGVDLGTLGECGRFFDANELRIIGEPRRASAWWSPLLLFAGYALVLGGGLLVLHNEAFLSIRSNGHWLQMTSTTGRPLFAGHGAMMSPADCQAGKDPAGFGSDRETVCKFLADPRLPRSVSDTVAGQRTIGGTILLFGLFVVGMAFGSLSVSREAKAIRAVRNDLAWHERESADGSIPGR